MENNNINKSPAIDGYMNNTLHKKEERRFQEERRDVMKMNKMFAGLIAFVAGVALSAGSAFAIEGYIGGDPSVVKLIPYYEAGDTKATIIGVQNLSTHEDATMVQHERVASFQAFLMGKAPDATVIAALTGVDSATDLLGEDDLNTKAAAEAELEKAMDAVMTEHLFVAVNLYDDHGHMVGSAELCLAEHQFGAVSIQGPSGMMDEDYQLQRVSMMDDEIPAYGWVKVIAETQKLTSCDGGTRANPRMNIDTRARANLETGDPTTASTRTGVAAWTIIQDVGMGFFGTEVVTTSVMVNAKVGDDDVAEIACYDGPVQVVTDGAPTIPNANTAGAFQMSRCSLIPERDNNTRTAGTDADMNGHDDPQTDTATPRGAALVRYDVMDESMVVLWLAGGEDTEDTHPRMSRDVQVIVKCENGMVIDKMEDMFGDMVDIMVDAPNKLTMIDPSMGVVGDATAMCDGYRGALKIMMPDGSSAGMAFTHLTQLDGHFRMNFPAYGRSSSDNCNTGLTDTAAQVAACK